MTEEKDRKRKNRPSAKNRYLTDWQRKLREAKRIARGDNMTSPPSEDYGETDDWVDGP